MNASKVMAQFSVIVPEDLGELISEISRKSGRSVSSLCADYLQEGAYRHVEQLNKVEAWRNAATKSSKQVSKGKEAYILLAEKAKGRILTAEEIQFIIQALPEYDYSESDLM